MSESRVLVDIILEGGSQWSLITSDAQAEDFVQEWQKQIEGIQITISGVVEHTDANEVTIWFDKDKIMVVRKMEIKI